ncbi:MAG TPA: Ig-like domain-containing protein [Patescibacteria group bacterium]|nr:Ig-like domain-containing protein [Patescibacteria group bacterium]
MKKTSWLSVALLVLLLPSLPGMAQTPLDLQGPIVTWNNPGENTCWQIDRRHPDLGLVVSAEDPSGVKQGTMWMKAGHHTFTRDRSTWSRIWGRTYVRDGSAPASVRETIMIPMLGRAEGEYSFIVEFADMARHNTRYAVRHISVDFSAPTVAITSPADGRIVCRDKNLYVDVSAADSGCGIHAVQLYLNAVTSTTPVAVDASVPYQLVIPKERFSGDSLRIIVQAIDKAGRSSQAEITVRPTRICLVRAVR